MTTINANKILNVNLTDQKFESTDLDGELADQYIGGVGLGVKILYDNVGPEIAPLAPDNVVIIATGLLSGTAAPSSGRTEAITKSPLTGLIGRGNFGGRWGSRLKKAGFLAVVLKGCADKPVYLWIEDGRIELRNAEHLWGLDTWQTTDALKQTLGDDISVLSIGQAGENLVKFACPVADYSHAPGRSHVGCVMGAKKIKAIAVRGTQQIPAADAAGFKAAVKEAVARIDAYPDRGPITRVGTNFMVTAAAESGAIPSRNFQNGFVAPDSEIWSALEAVEKHLITEKESYCSTCPNAKYIGCDTTAVVKEGPYAGLKLGGVGFTFPGFEWGAKCGIENFPAIWKCRELCNRYGMDQATSIPFALELYEKNIISNTDTDGLELTWGNASAIQQMLKKIAYREGLGDLLAEGSAAAARKIGGAAEKYCMTVKGMEIISIDPRTRTWVEILGNMTGHRGGDDLDTTHSVYDERVAGWAMEAGWSDEKYLQWLVDWIDMPAALKRQIFGEPPRTEFFSRECLEGKAALVKWQGEFTSIVNSLGLCLMPTNYTRAMGPTHFARLYASHTGRSMTSTELMQTGERIFNLMRVFNIRQGLAEEDADWPERFYEEAWSTGVAKGNVAPRDKIKTLLDEYYQLRGWNQKTAIPTRQKLMELGLVDAVAELSELGFNEFDE